LAETRRTRMGPSISASRSSEMDTRESPERPPPGKNARERDTEGFRRRRENSHAAREELPTVLG